MKYMIEKFFDGDLGILKRIEEGDIEVAVLPLRNKNAKWRLSEDSTARHLFGEDVSDDDLTREEAIEYLKKAGFPESKIDEETVKE